MEKIYKKEGSIGKKENLTSRKNLCNDPSNQ
jgi:hypothetical protein